MRLGIFFESLDGSKYFLCHRQGDIFFPYLWINATTHVFHLNFFHKGESIKTNLRSKNHTRPPWKWKTSDLDHFRLKMTQKCITFEQKLQFTKFKALNWSEFHQKIEFPSTISTLGELMPPSNRTHVETIYTPGHRMHMTIKEKYFWVIQALVDPTKLSKLQNYHTEGN